MRTLLILLAIGATFALASNTMAADEVHPDATASVGHTGWFFPSGTATTVLGASIGAGIIVFGAAKGIGNIGSSAVEAIARQPEAGGRIFTAMLISAALIEGFTFFALLIPFLRSA